MTNRVLPMPHSRHLRLLLLSLGLCLLITPISLAGADAPTVRTATSATTPVNRNPKRHEEFLARLATGPVGLLFLGDSITAMWPFTSPTWKKFEKHEVANFAVPGERTEDLLWRITNGELEGMAPQVVVILIGTNNLAKKEEQPEWIAAGVKAILEVVQTKLPKAQIILMGLLPRAQPEDPLRARVKAVNELLKTFAVPEKITYLDIGEQLVDEHGEVKKFMPDLLHPNGKGFAVWDKALWPILSKLLESPATPVAPAH